MDSDGMDVSSTTVAKIWRHSYPETVLERE